MLSGYLVTGYLAIAISLSGYGSGHRLIGLWADRAVWLSG